MLQKEFFERTGINLTEQEFDQVHAIYMQAGDNVDKDQFCADWKKHNDSVLLQEFFAQSERLKGKVDGYRNQINEIALFLVDQAEKWSASDLRSMAIQILGLEKYLQIKLQKGYNLWDIDREDMIQILSNK